MSKDFTVVFEKLQQLQELAGTAEPGQARGIVVISSDSLREMDEIYELCRLVAEITEPEPLSCTMT